MSNIFGKIIQKIGVVVQAGGILNIENFNIESHQGLSRPRNEKLLLNQVRKEIYNRLEQSLHFHFINLDLESRPQLVVRSWDIEIKIGIKDSELLPKGTSILDVFNREDIGGRLLILGDPGSGKTIAQLELAKALLNEYVYADPEFPIPVLFHLASWSNNSSLYDWLIAELKAKYGVRPDISAKWLDNRKLLLLLDGLDELRAEFQKPCIEAINSFMSSEELPEYVVVCCRSKEYNILKTRLQLNGAIQLQSLTSEKIQAYLSEINKSSLWSLISADYQLLDLVKTPLMLTITALAYQEAVSEEWQKENIEEKRQILLNAYVRRMINPVSGSRIYKAKKIPTQKLTLKWLIWLAQQLESQAQSEFLIENIQPGQIGDGRQITKYLIILGSICFWLITLIMGLGNLLILAIINPESISSAFQSSSLISIIKNPYTLLWPIIHILFCIILAVVSTIMTVHFHIGNRNYIVNVQPNESLNFSVKNANKSIGSYLHSSLTNPAVFIYRFLLFAISIIFVGLKGFVLLTLFGMVYAWTANGFIGVEVAEKKFPNQGIILTLQNVLFFSALTSILLFPSIIIWQPNLGLIEASLFSLMSGFVWGGMRYARPAIQHFVIRLMLIYHGQAPWNYARFLDYCKERLLLQRVGGRYQFIHKSFQEYFAAMAFERF